MHTQHFLTFLSIKIGNSTPVMQHTRHLLPRVTENNWQGSSSYTKMVTELIYLVAKCLKQQEMRMQTRAPTATAFVCVAPSAHLFVSVVEGPLCTTDTNQSGPTTTDTNRWADGGCGCGWCPSGLVSACAYSCTGCLLAGVHSCVS